MDASGAARDFGWRPKSRWSAYSEEIAHHAECNPRLAGEQRSMKQPRHPEPQERIHLLSVVIPARDEEGRVGATVEHLYVELRLQGIEHEIVVVDDGSTDTTWTVLQQSLCRVPTLRPFQNNGERGFGRAVSFGLEQARGDAMVVMMADESDDCRDVVRYWQVLNEGWDAVFGSRFMRGGGVVDYPPHKLILNRLANLFLCLIIPCSAQRFYQCVQGLPPQSDRGLPSLSFSAFQPDDRDPAEDHCARLLLDGDPGHLEKPALGSL